MVVLGERFLTFPTCRLMGCDIVTRGPARAVSPVILWPSKQRPPRRVILGHNASPGSAKLQNAREHTHRPNSAELLSPAFSGIASSHTIVRHRFDLWHFNCPPGLGVFGRLLQWLALADGSESLRPRTTDSHAGSGILEPRTQPLSVCLCPQFSIKPPTPLAKSNALSAASFQPKLRVVLDFSLCEMIAITCRVITGPAIYLGPGL